MLFYTTNTENLFSDHAINLILSLTVVRHESRKFICAKEGK